MKRGRRIVFLFAVILVISLFIISGVYADEIQQIKKTYSWLENKAIGKWSGLNTEEHIFSLLALEYKMTPSQINTSINNLLSKSFDKTCFGKNTISREQDCTAFDTAMVKFAFDSLQSTQDTDNQSSWLLNKTKIFIPQNSIWYLQLIQPQSLTICDLDYDGETDEFIINQDNTIQQISQSKCFGIAETYWLGLKNENQCPEKTFNITCNESIQANFLFKKSNQWYITGQLMNIGAGETGSINLTSQCISNQSGCDYEATLWTAYAFSIKNPEITQTFLPYLLMQEPENQGLLPAAFLYKITGREDFADKILGLVGSDGLILANHSVYNEYHDTSLAQITNSDKNANIDKMHMQLLGEQKKESNYYYWLCSNSTCDAIKDTAMLLYGFWNNFQEKSECEQQGYSCPASCDAPGISVPELSCFSGQCCNLNLASDCKSRQGSCKPGCFDNETRVDYSCNSGSCCKLTSSSECVSEIHGQLCNSDQNCINSQGNVIDKITSSEGPLCCLGNCSDQRQDCSDIGGVICNPDEGKTCQDGFILAIQDFCCPSDKCILGQLTCDQQGGQKCNEDEECNGGVFVNASDVLGETCCISGGACIKSICTASKCLENELCVGGSMYETADALRCCEGTCLKSCQDLGGTPCNSSMKCSGSLENSGDFSDCCIGTCKEKGKFSWTIFLIILIILVLALAAFFLIKKFKKKSQDTNTEGIDDSNFPEIGFPNNSLKAPSSSVPNAPTAPASKKSRIDIPVPKKKF